MRPALKSVGDKPGDRPSRRPAASRRGSSIGVAEGDGGSSAAGPSSTLRSIATFHDAVQQPRACVSSGESNMSLSLTLAVLASLPVATPESLDAVTVTASRRPQAVSGVLADVSVIERGEIDASQAPDLLELLRRQAGVDLARTGGSGQQSSLFLRGSNSNHVLFLVDGVRVASSNTGAAAFEHLPLDQIERIEIVRGPRASYYGSDAIGGVIAITTRERNGASGLLRIGTNGRAAGAAAYGASSDTSAFSVQLGGEEYDGFSATLPEGFGYDPDDDGYSHRNLGVRARHQLGGQRLSFSGLATEQDVEFDQGVTDVRQHAIALNIEGALSDGWTHRLTVGGARDDLDTPAYGAQFSTRRENLDWVHDVTVAGDQHLVFGLNMQDERGSNIDTFAGATVYSAELNHYAGFVGWQGVNGDFDHELALRYDDHEAFGGEATGQAALGWNYTGGRVYLSWGQGFRAPNLNELYSPGFGGLFAGNPELDPERSHSLELGLDQRFGDVDFGANLYRTRISDLIAFQGGETFQAVNVARAAIDGLELTLDRQFEAWRIGANATFQDARNADSDRELLRRPDQKFNVELGYRFANGINVAGEAGYASERRDFDGPLDAYTLVAIRADWSFAEHWNLGARLGNAFDEEYSLASGFATPPREFIVTLRWE
jgi:vitamin B12 transporter